jgi:hypothetical protein
MTTVQQARQRAAELWKKMCQWDNVPTDSSFVVFTETNPYQAEYDAAMAFVMAYSRHRLQSI